MKISNTSLDSNGLDSNGLLGGTDGQGGALSLYGVRLATLTKTVFVNNSLAGLTDSGGAIAVRESSVEFRGVQFSRNVARHVFFLSKKIYIKK